MSGRGAGEGRPFLDTDAWAWTLTDDPRLSATARARIAAAQSVQVSPVSFFEIGQKVRLGKWPEMAPFAERLIDLLAQQGGTAAPFDAAICLMAGTMAWAHRDPFDRPLAATALQCSLPLVSAHTAFDALLARVW